MNPQPFLSALNKPRFSQVGQMARHLGLPHLKNIHQIAHALFSLGEEVENAQPVLIGEGSENFIGLVLAHDYICLCGYIISDV
jgi:hypothetical protein